MGSIVIVHTNAVLFSSSKKKCNMGLFSCTEMYWNVVKHIKKKAIKTLMQKSIENRSEGHFCGVQGQFLHFGKLPSDYMLCFQDMKRSFPKGTRTDN